MTDKLSEDEINRRHNEKSAKRKEFQDELVRKADKKKHLLIVHTGTGKGKSTAAFGTMLRALGHGYKVGVVQFIKGAWSTGEQKALAKFDSLVTYVVAGNGFTWDTQDRAGDMAKAREAWNIALSMIRDPSYHLVVLDELNIVLRYEYLPVEEVIHEVSSRVNHVIITGRNAPQSLIDSADLVTEMKMIKHPFREQGVMAQEGIEF